MFQDTVVLIFILVSCHRLKFTKHSTIVNEQTGIKSGFEYYIITSDTVLWLLELTISRVSPFRRQLSSRCFLPIFYQSENLSLNAVVLNVLHTRTTCKLRITTFYATSQSINPFLFLPSYRSCHSKNDLSFI